MEQQENIPIPVPHPHPPVEVNVKVVPKNKKPFFLIAGVFLLIIAALGIWGWQRQKKQLLDTKNINNVSTLNENNENTKNIPVPVDSVDISKLPSGFPQDLPLEKDAEIILNAQGNMPDNVAESSFRTFVSNKSLEYNFELYKNYFNDHGWKIDRVTNQPMRKSIVAVNTTDQKMITVDLSYKAESQTTVFITVINPIKSTLN